MPGLPRYNAGDHRLWIPSPLIKNGGYLHLFFGSVRQSLVNGNSTSYIREDNTFYLNLNRFGEIATLVQNDQITMAETRTVLLDGSAFGGDIKTEIRSTVTQLEWSISALLHTLMYGTDIEVDWVSGILRSLSQDKLHKLQNKFFAEFQTPPSPPLSFSILPILNNCLIPWSTGNTEVKTKALHFLMEMSKSRDWTAEVYQTIATNIPINLTEMVGLPAEKIHLIAAQFIKTGEGVNNIIEFVDINCTNEAYSEHCNQFINQLLTNASVNYELTEKQVDKWLFPKFGTFKFSEKITKVLIEGIYYLVIHAPTPRDQKHWLDRLTGIVDGSAQHLSGESAFISAVKTLSNVFDHKKLTYASAVEAAHSHIATDKNLGIFYYRNVSRALMQQQRSLTAAMFTESVDLIQWCANPAPLSNFRESYKRLHLSETSLIKVINAHKSTSDGSVEAIEFLLNAFRNNGKPVKNAVLDALLVITPNEDQSLRDIAGLLAQHLDEDLLDREPTMTEKLIKILDNSAYWDDGGALTDRYDTLLEMTSPSWEIILAPRQITDPRLFRFLQTKDGIDYPTISCVQQAIKGESADYDLLRDILRIFEELKDHNEVLHDLFREVNHLRHQVGLPSVDVRGRKALVRAINELGDRIVELTNQAQASNEQQLANTRRIRDLIVEQQIAVEILEDELNTLAIQKNRSDLIVERLKMLERSPELKADRIQLEQMIATVGQSSNVSGQMNKVNNRLQETLRTAIKDNRIQETIQDETHKLDEIAKHRAKITQQLQEAQKRLRDLESELFTVQTSTSYFSIDSIENDQLVDIQQRVNQYFSRRRELEDKRNRALSPENEDGWFYRECFSGRIENARISAFERRQQMRVSIQQRRQSLESMSPDVPNSEPQSQYWVKGS
jgi:hypothetical protein